jgi:hypothetical protein
VLRCLCESASFFFPCFSSLCCSLVFLELKGVELESSEEKGFSVAAGGVRSLVSTSQSDRAELAHVVADRA